MQISIVRAIVAALAGIFLLSGATATPAVGAQALRVADESLSWAVSPADEQGPDGRAWAELTLDPGRSVTEYLGVRNLGKQPATFRIKAADGYFTDTGRFNMLPSSTPSTAAGAWIAAPDSVEVAGGGTAVVPYTVTVPDNATPGDHAAGIAASVQFVGENPDGGGTLGVESRVGFRVITRVTGTVTPALAVGDLATSYETSWNPVTPGTMTVRTSVTNTGNVALVITGTASAGGAQAAFGIPDGATTIELLPGDERVVTATMTGVWPLGPVGSTAQFTATASDLDPVTVSTSATTWVVPWPQLAALVLLALLVLAVRAERRRRVARLRRMLAAERAAGRAESEGEPATMSTSNGS